MKVNIREDSVEVSGYVNAIERSSKPLHSRMGRFIERVCKGAFSNALKRGNDVRLLLNHNHNRDLGGIKDGNLELAEDAIGLRAKATITDPDVIKDARNGDLVGWSFGFEDVPGGVEETRDQESGLPMRKVKDLILKEVSLLNRAKSPAYEGTLVMVRDDDSVEYRAEDFEDEVAVIPGEEVREEEQQEEIPDDNKTIDYSPYEAIIEEMKGGYHD